MSRWVSELLALPPHDVLLIAPPQGRRARAFQDTLQELGWPPARTISYLDVLEGRAHLAELVRPGSIVRFDSPGEDAATERELIRRGSADVERADVDLDAGELAPTDAWFTGLTQVLHELDAQLSQAAPHRRMQHTDHLLTMFDKPATHARLLAAGVAVPPALPNVTSGEALVRAAREHGWSRVFVKLAHGSSASGAIALEWSGERVQAMTTVRREGGRLFNSRRLLRLTSWPEVLGLIDALAPQGLHVERWLPKASAPDSAGTMRAMDMRVVVTGGRAEHALLRLGRGPITNLHLGNERGDVTALRTELGERWQTIQQTCTDALAAFPGALYGGVDLLLTPDFRRQAVLEVNAFGDYHRGVLARGRDTYAAELAALLERGE